MPRRQLQVGIVGGGLGGLAASIAIARSGAQVTVLEAATKLGEIGAGIHVCTHARTQPTRLSFLRELNWCRCFLMRRDSCGGGVWRS